MYKKINATFTPTDEKNNQAEWLELRKTGIGGSDAGAILGFNKYASPCSVYLAKKGFESSFKGNAATEWGHILEEPLRNQLRDMFPWFKIETVSGMFTSKEYPFMNANLDGLIYTDRETTIKGETISGLGGLEIKTSSTGEGFESDEIPDSYYCQVQHYMAVTGLDWFILTVFFFNSKNGDVYVIRRNQDFINDLIKKEKSFWEDFVEKDIIPPAMGVSNEKDIITNLELSESVELDTQDETILKNLLDTQSEIKRLKATEDKLKNSIILSLYEKSTNKKAEKTTAQIGNIKVSYATQKSNRVDTDALKKAGLYEDYSRETVSKVLRVSEVKGK